MSPKSLSDKYPKELNSLGDHIRKRRIDLKLLQKQVAEQMGVNESSILNWENNATSPQVHHIPGIVQFLGYDPFPTPETQADLLKRARRLWGLSQLQMADRLGIDPTTLARWERGEGRPSKKLYQVVKEVFGVVNGNANAALETRTFYGHAWKKGLPQTRLNRLPD